MTCGLLHNLTSLLKLRESLQSEEVHFDKTCRLDNMTIILCDRNLQAFEVRVVGCRHRYPVADGITTDDEATGVDTSTTHSTLKHLCIFYGVALTWVGRRFSFTKLRCTLDSIRQVHLQAVRQTLRDSLTQRIRDVERQFLYTSHILDRVLGSHTGVGDDMRAVFMTIFVHYPLQHPTSTIIVEVGIDIREVHTVRVQETLKQQVVFQRVYLGDTQAISHNRTCSRTTTRTYHHAKFGAGSIDKVGHDKEVAWETHRLHYVKFEVDMLFHLVRKILAIATWVASTIIGKLSKIVGFKFYTIYLVVATKTVDNLLTFFWRQLVVAILVGSKLTI